MRSLRRGPRRPWVVPGVVGALLGFGLGFVLSPAFVKWSLEWFNATGTWFGGIATAGAVLWAVQAFRLEEKRRRAETFRRERTRIRADRAAVNRELERQQQEADQMLFSASTGSGYGMPPVAMTSVNFRMINATGRTISDVSVASDDLRLDRETPRAVSLSSGEDKSFNVGIAEVSAPAEGLSGQPMTSYTARVAFTLDGRRWERLSGSEHATRLSGD